jgi:hypothetical protein
MLNIQIRPVTLWPGKETKSPKRSQFKQTYKNTLELLEYELSKADAQMSSLVIEMWVDPKDIRLDGQLRVTAKPVVKQGVIFRFTRLTNIRWSPERQCNVGTPQQLAYPCDAFDRWQDNLRAIALSMERLRSVERYGVFKYDDIVSRLALPSAEGKVSTRESAAAFLAQHSGVAMKEILFSDTARATAYRKAAHALHPDRGGDPEKFVKLAEANKVLSESARSAGSNQ